MEAGGGSGNRAALPRVDGLIAFAIGGRILARNIGRQRDVPDLFEHREEIRYGRESDAALAKIGPRDDFGLQFIALPEEQMFAHSNLSSGPHQAFPFIGFSLQLAGEQNFNATAKKISSGGIFCANRLRVHAAASPVEPCGKHASVVEDY